MGENSVNTQVNTQNNYQVKKPVSTAVSSNTTISSANTKQSLRDEFVREKKNKGLFERFYDFCKNTTGLGLGSKKVEKAITSYENGELTEADAKAKISDYKISRENAEQHFGDLAAGATTITGFYTLNNFAKKTKSKFELNVFKEVENATKEAGGIPGKVYNIFKKIVTTNKKFAVMLPALAVVGAFTKWAVLKVNRIGSKEYKVENEKQLSKTEYKKAKKAINRQRHKQNFKNFFTGALDGLLAPVTLLVGGIVGIPAYILATSGLRFATSKKDGQKTTLGNFADTIKNNVAFDALLTAAVAIPAFKKAHFSNVLSKNLKTVTEKLKGAKLIEAKLPSSQSTLKELSEELFNSTKINDIFYDKTLTLNEKITKLIDENLFAAKFLQVADRKSLPIELQDLAEQLVEKCPPSRTLDEAKTEIAKLLGDSNEYEVTKLLGTGTVAETYLAKNTKTAEEVCIKILKKGIDAEKILKDKESFIQVITKGAPKEKWTERQQYLVKNIDNMAEGLLKEVDLEHEKEAALKLVPYTKVCNVVKPILAKKGIYVMEKAKGISLKTLIDYYSMKKAIQAGNVFNPAKAMEELKAHAPAFNDIDLDAKDIKYLLKGYMNVMIEQLNKIGKSGKTLHADIHPGNIFIDLDALKSKKGKLYTLIDTGNTVDLTQAQAQRVLKLTAYVKNGNVKELTDYLLDGAVLPQGMTQAEATQKVSGRLKQLFFEIKDNQTEKIERLNVDSFKKLSNAIYKEYGIIPNDAHLTLEKAKASADDSLSKLADSFLMDEAERFTKNFDKDANKAEKVAKIGAFAGRVGSMGLRKVFLNWWQETKNLTHLSPTEMVHYFRNPDNLKTNSEDYLIYKLKQTMNTNPINKELAEEID